MHDLIVQPNMILYKPSVCLRPFVNHYWLSLNNVSQTFPVLPDGSVDIVISANTSSAKTFVFGTTKTKQTVPITIGNHYLGINFKPAKNRHFIKCAAIELTDCFENAEDLLKFNLEGIAEQIGDINVFSQIDKILEKYISKLQPLNNKIDQAIELIQSSFGTIEIDKVAKVFEKSNRQFERVFLESVGVSPKLLSQISRYRHAITLIYQSQSSLADIALDCGYFDQSHMNNEFKRFTSQSPMQYKKNSVVFLQDCVQYQP